jgi:hypothetical protein
MIWNLYLRVLQKDIILVDDNSVLVRGKGKAIPLQAWSGPEGSRRLRLPDFRTIGT